MKSISMVKGVFIFLFMMIAILCEAYSMAE